MPWEFDPDVACATIVDFISDKVGDELGVLVTPQGSQTTIPAVYLTNQNIPEPTLPFITVDLLTSNDRFGHTLNSGLISAEEAGDEDPDDDTYYLYKDVYLEYTIRLRCEGDGGHKILRKIRNLLLFEDAINTIEEGCYSSIQYIQPVRRVPELFNTNFREINTTDLVLNTVDRYIDYSSTVFDTINYSSTLKETVDDTTPLTSEGSVSSTDTDS